MKQKTLEIGLSIYADSIEVKLMDRYLDGWWWCCCRCESERSYVFGNLLD